MGPSVESPGHTEPFQLRQRLQQGPDASEEAPSADAARETVLELNSQEEKSGKGQEGRRTYGRTPDQKVFIVPQTHDMVSQLLSPTQPKNLSDIALLAVLGSFLLMLWKLPTRLSIPAFAVLFLFWRAMYNGGIGWLLYQQSNYRLLVHWAKKYKIFQDPATGEQPRPLLYKFLRREFEAKISKDYKFEVAPIEYNTWLLFRRFVDLVLLCDFVCYCCFAMACGGRPEGEHLVITILRWFAGIILFLFNVWVKLDAHRVVKDYAWYWGDFFFLVDQQLTFDGVFEMAPHPMYSVGYAGFYGISLMAASYRVLFISIIGHAAQFVFLALVESPHIDKTYNVPPARLIPAISTSSPENSHRRSLSESQELEPGVQRVPSATTPTQQAPYIRNLIGIDNLDFHRVIDVAAILLQFYLYALTILTPSTLTYQIVFVVNAAAWRLWYAAGIGYILVSQSNEKKWTRHFIKYGESTEEAWRQWKGVYHISMTMCYASFIAAAYKMYTIPPDWSYGMATLRHIFGVALILLQFWTISSIYESLGEFGWFYGDFFFDQKPKLTYSGIYRYLNNPERVIGLAGVWGVATITWSKSVFFLALLSHTSSLIFIHFVERPHMEKRYGQSLRQASGVSKTFQRSLPRPFRNFQGSVDRVFEDTVDIVEDFIEAARPKLAAGYETFVRDTVALFKHYPARLSVMRLSPDMAGFDPKDYSLEIDGTPQLDPSAAADKFSDREGDAALTSAASGIEAYKPLVLEYGAPIKVRWKAPLNHSNQDWLGLYMVADNASRLVTSVPAQGRWIATNAGVFDSFHASDGIRSSDTPAWKDVSLAHHAAGGATEPCLAGEVEFAGDKLWWTTGVFEIRYHHAGSHNVLAISRPFESRIAAFYEDSVELADPVGGGTGAGTVPGGAMLAQVEQLLLPLVQNCFDRDPKIAPRDVEEPYGSLVERNGKFAKRVVFGVRQMFGIEFAPQVVRADGTVRNLAWRICNAKLILAPYSMSRSRGTTTPTEAKD